MTTAEDQRPKLFSDYAGQKGAIGYTTSVIKSGLHPSGLLISGMPGTGKTTLAHLYVKATLCEERPEGEYEPCGKCDSCLADIEKGNHPNVTYYRITEATVFKEAVGDLISMTKASPVLTHDNNRSDNRRRFIIIDELQNASRQSISPFLDSLEFAADEVTVILISMDLDRLDYVVRDAIQSRCIELGLDKISRSVISDTLCSKMPDLHPEASDAIAYLSRGNLRKAWSLFDYFAAQLPVEEITAEFISDQKIGGLSRDKCLSIINSLENDTWETTNKLLKEVSNNPIAAVDFFINIICEEDLNCNGIDLLSACSLWCISNYKVPVLALFRPYQGKKLIGPVASTQLLEPEPEPRLYSVPTIHSKPVHVQRVKQNITGQLSSILGEQVKVRYKRCPVLEYTKWSQILEHYADNN